MNSIIQGVFKNKKLNGQKLLNCGFVKTDTGFTHTRTVCGGQFELRVNISADGRIKADLYDTETGDPFTLFLAEGVTGAFVGEVRAEYERALSEIADGCFDREVFSEPAIKQAIIYVREKYGAELEFLWKDEDAAIWRRADNSKWFGLIIKVPVRRLGIDEDGTQEALVVRAEPEEIDAIVDGVKYLRGYHMNKKHWLTVLPSAAQTHELFKRIDASFILAKK